MALAAALIESPDVLILDEPTNHLSVEGVEFLVTAVRENKKMAALFATLLEITPNASITVVIPDKIVPYILFTPFVKRFWRLSAEIVPSNPAKFF